MQPVPVYIHYNHQPSLSSEVQRCLERDKGLADLLTKSLQGKEFTEEDTERITDCVAERIDAENSQCKVGMITALVLFFLALIIFAIVEIRM